VATLRDTVASAIAEVLGPDAVPLAPEHVQGYQPHVSVAYGNAEASGDPIAEALALVEPPPATVKILAASLIVLDRDEHVYRWSRYGEIPLGGKVGARAVR
jgi:hypothetical protein